MNSLLLWGRLLFAISIMAFGIQYFLHGRFLGGLPPVPPGTPGGPWAAYSTGAVLMAAGIGMTTRTKASSSATLLGSFFLLCVLLLHAPRAAAILTNGVDRTRAFEALALGAAALVMAPALRSETMPSQVMSAAQKRLAQAGRWLFAFSLAVFGAQHFQFAPFIATLVPSWIPGHLFWAYFTGVAMLTAAVAIALNFYGHLAAAWLGIMFLLWVLVLHGPRVAAQPSREDEWTSAFVALALCGAGFAVSDALRNRQTIRLFSGKNQAKV